jgi:putative salt-induced outer membrane protein YdiY
VGDGGESVRAGARAILGVALLTTLLVTREGLEAVLYLGIKLFALKAVNVALGAGLGLALAGVVAWTWSRFAHRLNLGVVLKVTSIFLAIFLVQLVVFGVHELAESGFIEGTQGLHNATEILGPDGAIGHFLSYSLLGAPLLYVFWARRAKAARAVVKMVTLTLVFLASREAAAQKDVKFDFGKPEEVKAVEWKAQAKGGFLMTSGNSSTTNGTGSVTASRKEGNNKFALEANLAYGKSRVFDATTDVTVPAMPVITALTPRTVETTNSWLAKARYDRFFTTNNAAYLMAIGSGDKIAGKTFAGGGQIGYSRQLVKNDLHLVVAELGYDFSYERYQPQPDKTLDPVSIHSARAFVGETIKATEHTGLTASVEALVNLNKESGAVNVDTGGKGVDAFKDTRVLGKLGVTTTVYKSLSIGLGFTLKYDQNPAPRPLPPGSAAGTTFGPNVRAFADTVDTLTEATLIYTFL